MEEWKLTKIGSICKKVCSGGTPKSTVKEYYGGGIPWLNTKEVHFNRIYSTESTITYNGLNNSAAKWIEANAVIIAMYGATAAKCAIGMIPMTTNQACCNLMIDEKKADYRFVYYGIANSYSILASLANGGAQQNLNAQVIKDFEILLPSLVIQKRIADVLSTLDDKIECNRRINDNFTLSLLLLTCFVLWLLKLRNDNLEQQAQALFKSWFVDFEPFKDGEFVESEKGMIPKGWKVGTLGELCAFKRGKNLLTKDSILGEVPVVAGGLEPSCYHNVANTKSPVITVSGSGANAGFMRMYYQEVWASDCSFIDSTCENLFFVYCFLTINRRLLRHAQTGAVQPHVKPADIHNFDLVIPPKDIINQFQRIVSDTFTMRGSIEKESRRLGQLRDTLLPRLMSGELKVNELETIKQ